MKMNKTKKKGKLGKLGPKAILTLYSYRAL